MLLEKIKEFGNENILVCIPKNIGENFDFVYGTVVKVSDGKTKINILYNEDSNTHNVMFHLDSLEQFFESLVNSEVIVKKQTLNYIEVDCLQDTILELRNNLRKLKYKIHPSLYRNKYNYIKYRIKVLEKILVKGDTKTFESIKLTIINRR